MAARIETDPRLDPRIKAFFAGLPTGLPQPSVASRDELLAEEYAPDAMAALELQTKVFDSMDSEALAPSDGLTVRNDTFTSAPDGNDIEIITIRPDTTGCCPACTTSTAAAWR